MRSIAAFALASTILGLALPTQSQAEEHYIYRDATGKLVISNKPPPAGSEVLKKLDLIDGKQPGEDRDTQLKNPEAPPKPTRDK